MHLLVCYLHLTLTTSVAKQRPDPTPGTTIKLHFLGSVFHVELPHTIDEQQLTETSSFNEKYNPKHHVRRSWPKALAPTY
jgi:hypothetical protein